MKHKLSKGQKLAIIWLVFSTIVLYVNSILAIKYELYGTQEHYKFAFLLPMIHLGSITLFGFVCYCYSESPNCKWRKDDEYIKQNYPEIWNRLHTGITGKVSSLYGNSFAGSKFITGKFDNGTDDRLNRIKFSVRFGQNIIGAALLLTIANIVFSFILYIVCHKTH